MKLTSKKKIITVVPLLIFLVAGIIAVEIYKLPNALKTEDRLATLSNVENTPTPQITVEQTIEVILTVTPTNQSTSTENNKTTTSTINVTTPTKSTPTRIRMRCPETREAQLTSEIATLTSQINSLQLKLDTELKACQNRAHFNTDTYLIPPCETSYISCLSDYPNNSLTCEESKKICIDKANDFRSNEIQGCTIVYQGNKDLYGNYRNEDTKRLDDLKLQLLQANSILQLCKTPI